MKPWKKRFVFVILILASVAIGVGIILKTFNENILFFYSPTDLLEHKITPSSKIIRVGGLVKIGSIKKINGSSEIEFTITDNQNELIVHYNGILPNLFKEKQGTVALGALKTQNYFEANELLAKHDENYTPKEVASSLKQ
ncbi:MAG: ccmE [Candidatus Midichloriaceae bacterium]|jgi:cytochrome c-type biogenesis protein CcmE|nr:ccmE [Candidatus Midichloriaceae bacterium]